jgi:DNA-binding transcriptional LysR family regulator
VELKHLTSFIAVADRLSFIRAAEHLHLSQPALSGQIQKLEEELGVQLLFRDRRSVSLTDAGAVFLDEARATLARAQRAASRTRRAALGQLGHLRIGFVSSAALELVPGIVVEFRKKFPGVTLDLLNLRTSSQIKRLTTDTLDIGFVRLPLSDDRLKTAIIDREPFVVVLPKEHRLARVRHIRVAQLEQEPFVAYGRRWAPGFFDSVIQICLDAGFRPQIVQETGEMYTAIALVAAGAGIAILPQSVVLAQSQHIVLKALPASIPPSEIALATKAGNRSSLIRSFTALAHTYRDRR